MADVFSGQIIQARPMVSLYDPGSLIQIKLKGDVKFVSGAPYTVWYTGWKALDENGAVLGGDVRSHSMAPWTKTDYATDEFTLSCGKAPDNSFNMRVRLRAAPGTLPWTELGWHFIADVYVPINVARSVVAPSPIPTVPSLVAGIPAPAPVPTIIPQPGTNTTPVTTVVPAPTPALTTMPTTTPSPISLPFDWKWLVIGGVAILAVTMMGKPKGAKK